MWRVLLQGHAGRKIGASPPSGDKGDTARRHLAHVLTVCGSVEAAGTLLAWCWDTTAGRERGLDQLAKVDLSQG